MSNLKRIASLLVVAILMLQFTAVGAAPIPQDVVGTKYEEAVGLLSALDIMSGDGTNFNYDADITRGEFAQILMKTMRLDDAVGAYTPVGTFTDVPTDSIFAPAIELGVSAGAIKGYGDGTFGPDDKVTGMQALKLMTYATNYNVKAELQGGYPVGYRMISSDIGLLKGVGNIDLDQPIDRGTAAIIVFNALKVDMLQIYKTGVETTYNTIYGENLLTLKHNVHTFSGLVTSNEATGMMGESTLRKNAVAITNKTTEYMLAGDTDIADQLGKYVRVHYLKVDPNDEDSDLIVLGYEVLDNRNTVITVDISDIESSSTTKKVNYWNDRENDNRTRVINISDTPDVIFNGVYTGSDFITLINSADEGNCMFVDNNGDGVMDFVYVTAYENYIVQNIDEENYILTDKISSKSITLDIEDPNVFVSITDVDGNELEFSDIEKDSVVSIAASEDTNARKMFKVIVSDETAEGVVDGIDYSNDEYTFIVDGEYYELTPKFISTITTSTGAIKIAPGDEYTFYIDAFGKIADAKVLAQSGTNFAILQDYQIGRSTDSAMIRVYFDGDIVDLELSNRVKIDGETCKNAETAVAELDAAVAYTQVVGSATIKSRLYSDSSKYIALLYKTDADGKVNYIDTVRRGAKESAYTLQYKGDNDKFASVGYNSGSTLLGGTHPLLPTAQVITIPESVANAKLVKNYKAQRGSTMPNSGADADVHNVQMYVTDPDAYKVEFLVIKSKGVVSVFPDAGANHDIQMLVVSNVVKCLDDEGEETIKIYGMMEGAPKQETVNTDYYADLTGGLYKGVVLDTLAVGGPSAKPAAGRVVTDASGNAIAPLNIVLPGDTIRYVKDGDGNISVARSLFLYEEKIFRQDSEGTVIEWRGFHMGMVNDIKDGSLMFLQEYPQGSLDNSGSFLVPTWDENTCKLYTASGFKIMVFDPSKASNPVTTGKVTDLYTQTSAKPSLVLLQLRANNPRGLVIFKY